MNESDNSNPMESDAALEQLHKAVDQFQQLLTAKLTEQGLIPKGGSVFLDIRSRETGVLTGVDDTHWYGEAEYVIRVYSPLGMSERRFRRHQLVGLIQGGKLHA